MDQQQDKTVLFGLMPTKVKTRRKILLAVYGALKRKDIIFESTVTIFYQVIPLYHNHLNARSPDQAGRARRVMKSWSAAIWSRLKKKVKDQGAKPCAFSV